MLKVIFNLLLLCCFVMSYAQSDYLNEQVVPPSPSVCAFQQYDFSSTDYYSGCPNITIPIHTIKVGNFEFPINLSYKYNGFKVNQMAGWLGLGWNINAGGMISHVVRGKPDESVSSYGYNKVRDEIGIPDPINDESGYSTFFSDLVEAAGKVDGSLESDERNILGYFADGKYDGLVDDYALSAFNLSGRIIELNDGSYVTNPYHKYAIYKAGNYWNIYDESGNQFVFGSASGDYGIEKTSYIFDYGDNSDTEGYVSNWFLRKIITNQKEEIIFNYAEETDVSLSAESFTSTRILKGNNGDCFNSSEGKTYTTYSPTKTWKLSSIEYSGCTILFYSDTKRKDVLTGSTMCSLDSICIKNNNEVIKRFYFTYDYIGYSSNNLTCRLMLNQIQEFGKKCSDSKSYDFDYDKSVTVPSYYSYAQDFWGYYNGITSNGSYGETNATLIPAYVPNSNYNDYFSSYADRSVHEKYSKLGLLTKAVYPTLGEVTYEYEPNTYGAIKGKNIDEDYLFDATLTKNASVKAIESNHDGTTEIISKIWIQKDQTVTIVYSIQNNNSAIEEAGEVSFYQFVDDPEFNLKLNNQSGTVELNIPAGFYTLKATVYDIGHTASISLKYDSYKTDENGNLIYDTEELTGGYRVKTITQYDGIDHSNDKILNFTYLVPDDRANRSSGVLNYPISYDKPVSQAKIIESAPGSLLNTYIDGDWCSFIQRGGSSLLPTFGNDGHIGYRYILVEEGQNNEKGSTLYNFTSSFGNADIAYSGVPQVIDKSYKRGKLIKMTQMNSENVPVYSKEESYTTELSRNKHGVAGIFSVRYLHNSINNYLDTYSTIYYGIVPSEWYYLSSSTETYYYPTGDIINTTSFHYENEENAQVTNITTNRSDGDEKVELFKYSNDYSTYPYTLMVSKNIISPVIDKEVYIKNELTDGMHVEYNGFNGDNIFLPSVVSVLNSESLALDERITFGPYSSNGNICQSQKTNDIPISYIWGYNNQYPIAKVENATYAQVSAAIDIAYIQDLSNQDVDASSEETLRSALSVLRDIEGAMVTIYTYDPLIGMTSQTDPNGITTFYQYDSMGRLSCIKDKDRNVIQYYDYHYNSEN